MRSIVGWPVWWGATRVQDCPGVKCPTSCSLWCTYAYKKRWLHNPRGLSLIWPIFLVDAALFEQHMTAYLLIYSMSTSPMLLLFPFASTLLRTSAHMIFQSSFLLSFHNTMCTCFGSTPPANIQWQLFHCAGLQSAQWKSISNPFGEYSIGELYANWINSGWDPSQLGIGLREHVVEPIQWVSQFVNHMLTTNSDYRS